VSAASPVGRIKRLLPWLVGLGFLTFLVLRVPRTELVAAIAGGPYLKIVAMMSLVVVLTLAADGWASAVSLAATGIRRPIRELLLVRGATYLVGQLNYALGQGAVGLYLHRAGVPGRRATGAILFMLAVNGTALVVLAAATWPLAEVPLPHPFPLLALAAVLIGGVILTPWLLRHQGLGAHPALAAWAHAGPAGALRALAVRLVHMLVLIVGQWGLLRVWGISVPALDGLALMPVVALVMALPISPSGIGTTQTAQVLLFSRFVSAPTAAERESVVLAAGLVCHLIGVALQIVVASWCWWKLQQLAYIDRPAARPGEIDEG
jgi:hypothetical protein